MPYSLTSIAQNPCGVTREDKRHLIAAYETASVRFSQAVTELEQRMGTCSKEEYELLRIATEQARFESEQARLALRERMAVDNC